MPLPKPNPDEDKGDFIARCMDEAVEEFEDPEQARAVCETQWEDARVEGRRFPWHIELDGPYTFNGEVIETGGYAGPDIKNFLYQGVARAVFNEPWALTADMYAIICELVRFRIDGGRLSAEEVQERIGAAPKAPIRQGAAGSGSVAVLPLYGVLGQRMNMMTSSGGTSTEQFGKAFRDAAADPAIGAIVIDVDSPGGSVFGISELWQTIMDARGSKPIVAVANSLAASAAYWVASAADEIVATPGGEVGSIGVLAAHEDLSGVEEREGRKTTLISAGKHKAAGNPYEPLTAEARELIQDKVNSYYSTFVKAVARGRGVTDREIRSGYGEGNTVLASEALRQGMVDRIATLDQTISRLLGRQRATKADNQRRAALL